MTSTETLDKLALYDVVQSWALYRDTGDWDGLKSVLHPDAHMTATWFDGPFTEFITAVQASWRKGSKSQHFLGGSVAQIVGNKAIAQTRMTIMVRGALEGQEVDVSCVGRFYDRVVKVGGDWKILKRNVIYEKDRMDLVNPGALLELDTNKLSQFPEGYRHLAYLQTSHGAQVSTHLATAHGEAFERLVQDAQAWLHS